MSNVHVLILHTWQIVFIFKLLVLTTLHQLDSIVVPVTSIRNYTNQSCILVVVIFLEQTSSSVNMEINSLTRTLSATEWNYLLVPAMPMPLMIVDPSLASYSILLVSLFIKNMSNSLSLTLVSLNQIFIYFILRPKWQSIFVRFYNFLEFIFLNLSVAWRIAKPLLI